MKKTMKRALSIVLALVMVLGLAPAIAKNDAEAADVTDSYIQLKNGNTKSANITPSHEKENFIIKVERASKLTLDIYTDLTGGASAYLKKEGFANIDECKKPRIDNGHTETIVCYCAPGNYYLSVARLTVGESGLIKVSCKMEKLNIQHDVEPNDLVSEATEIKTGHFTGSFIYKGTENTGVNEGDRSIYQDTYKFTMQEAGLFTFTVTALEGRKMDFAIGDLDSMGVFEEREKKEISCESGADDAATISVNLSAGTHYIIIKSTSMGKYKFATDYIKTPVEEIVLKKKKFNVKIGDKFYIYKSITPEDSNTGVTYKFSDKTKVEVLNSKTGWLQAKNAGKTKVTIKYAGNKKVVCTINVKPKK